MEQIFAEDGSPYDPMLQNYEKNDREIDSTKLDAENDTHLLRM